MADATPVFLDTETTSLDTALAVPWEIAAIDAGRELVWQVHLDAADLRATDPGALAVGRWWERRDPAIEQPAEDVAWEVAEVLAGRTLVGVNVAYDAAVLTSWMRRNGVPAPTWHYRTVSVEVMAAGWLHGFATGIEALDYLDPRANDRTGTELPWRSDDLSRACGIDPAAYERHSALGDARWTRDIYRRLTGVTS